MNDEVRSDTRTSTLTPTLSHGEREHTLKMATKGRHFAFT